MTYKEASKELGEWYGGFTDKPSEEAIQMILQGLEKLDEIKLYTNLQIELVESLQEKSKYYSEFASGFLMALLNIYQCLGNPSITWRREK